MNLNISIKQLTNFEFFDLNLTKQMLQFVTGLYQLMLHSGAGTFFRQGGLKIVRSCQRLGGEAPQTPLFSNARF